MKVLRISLCAGQTLERMLRCLSFLAVLLLIVPVGFCCIPLKAESSAREHACCDQQSSEKQGPPSQAACDTCGLCADRAVDINLLQVPALTHVLAFPQPATFIFANLLPLDLSSQPDSEPRPPWADFRVPLLAQVHLRHSLVPVAPPGCA